MHVIVNNVVTFSDPDKVTLNYCNTMQQEFYFPNNKLELSMKYFSYQEAKFGIMFPKVFKIQVILNISKINIKNFLLVTMEIRFYFSL